MVVTVANNGREAIESILDFRFEILDFRTEKPSQLPYDAILMDLQMPEMDGYEATQKIRELEQHSQSQIKNLKSKISPIPIIGLTAHALVEERQRCLDGGMNDYVTKPIDPEKLFAALVRWIPPGNRNLKLDTGNLGEGTSTDQYSVASSQYPVSSVQFPEDLPGIDVQSGMARVGGNGEAYRKLLIKFSRNHADAPAEIGDALERGDIDQALRLAHTMKGVAGNLGADNLSTAARELETGIKTCGGESIAPLMENFANALRQVITAIEALEQGEKSAQPSEDVALNDIMSIDISTVTPVLQQLAALLEDDDMEAASYLDIHKEFLNGLNVAHEVQELEEALGQYDFEQALDVLETIAQRLEISLPDSVN